MDPVADPLPPLATSKYLPILESLAMGTRITTTAEMISWINVKARTSEMNLYSPRRHGIRKKCTHCITEYGESSEGKPTPEIQTDSDGKEADAAGIQPERIG